MANTKVDFYHSKNVRVVGLANKLWDYKLRYS